MSMGMHVSISSKPGRIVALDRFTRYTKSFPNVWFVRPSEIARLWLENFPLAK
jgi:hypothetical protein